MKKDINQLTYDYSVAMTEYLNSKIIELNQQRKVINKLYEKAAIATMTDTFNLNAYDKFDTCRNLLDSIDNYIDTLKQMQKSIDIIDENIDYINEYLNDNIDNLKYKLGLL